MRKIALEEHFLSPGFEDYWLPTMGNVDQKAVSGLLGRLKDFGDTRVAAMDSAGIARAVLSISGPGVQVERDAATARQRAAEANDFLAGEVAKRTRHDHLHHRAAEFQVADAAFQFVGGGARVLHGQMPKTGVAVGSLGDLAG